MEAKFNVGDLVKIFYAPMDGDLGIIIKQGVEVVFHGTGLNISTAEWLVHLTDGREIWLYTNELINV